MVGYIGGHEFGLPSYGLFSGAGKSFFGLEDSFFCPKIRFLQYDPKCGRRPDCSPQRDGSFRTWDQFFDFLFPSYSRFRKKKLGRRAKTPSPSQLWGHRLPVTALALSARRPFSVSSVNSVNSVNNVTSFNSYSAVLPPSPMVFLNKISV